jgi:molybdopterin converting factor small subunit
MAISFRIPSYLASFAGGQTSLAIGNLPATVNEALEALWQAHPGLRDRIVDEQGEVRQHINIFVGDEAIRFADGLATKVPNGAEILIVPAVSGGK